MQPADINTLLFNLCKSQPFSLSVSFCLNVLKINMHQHWIHIHNKGRPWLWKWRRPKKSQRTNKNLERLSNHYLLKYTWRKMTNWYFNKKWNKAISMMRRKSPSSDVEMSKNWISWRPSWVFGGHLGLNLRNL